MSKPILCVDWDGVIHSYTSGWQGAHVSEDPPVPGAVAFLRDAVKHFRVAIFSSRSNQPGGVVGMQLALQDWTAEQDQVWLDEIEWPTEKPPAMVTLDDRAITFTGEWPAIETLLGFKPWNKK